jgi:hypothetical protein
VWCEVQKRQLQAGAACRASTMYKKHVGEGGEAPAQVDAAPGLPAMHNRHGMTAVHNIYGVHPVKHAGGQVSG